MKLIKMKCPSCGADLEIEEKDDRKMFFCQYCGQKIFVDDESKKIYIKKEVEVRNEYVDQAAIKREERKIKKLENDRKDSKAANIGIIVCLLILISMAVIPLTISKVKADNAKKEGKISAGYSDSLEDQDYRTVEAHFRSAGFNNIELIDLNDSGIAIWKKDKVESISIEGKTSFDEDDYFYPDSKVVISYH